MIIILYELYVVLRYLYISASIIKPLLIIFNSKIYWAYFAEYLLA